MRGRVAAVVLLFLIATPALPQCNFTPTASAQFRSTIYDLDIDHGSLVAATGYGLVAYDATVDPPRVFGSIALPGSTRVVRLLPGAGGVAYAAGGSAIQVVLWTGTLTLVTTVDAGANVNDLAVANNYLYAATTNGIVQFDLLHPTAPAKTTATFATSGSNVTSLALAGNTMYATDGDASVEVFNVAIGSAPQRLGSFNTLLPRPTAVSAANGRVYVSDGLQTDLLVGQDANVSSVSASAFPFGSSSFAALTDSAIFVAGSDRRLRAFDVSAAAAPIAIFGTELAATSGTVNRINALIISNGRLYAGAGDIGLLTYDLRQFTTPYPMRAYGTTPTTSVATADARVYFGRANGVIEYTQTSSGALTESRSWDTSHADAVQDFDNGFLLTSSGGTATLWALSPATPALVGSATFPTAVQQAVLAGTKAFAVLADHTLWTADLATSNATPKLIDLKIVPQFIARSGSNVAVADLRSDGTTFVAMLNATHDAIASSATVPGVATSGIALAGTTAAAWTFRGITLIAFPAGTQTLLPQSNSVAAAALAMNGTRLVEMTDSAAIMWDTAAQKATAQYTLPSTPASVAISPNGLFASLATFGGVASIQLAPSSRLPSLIASGNTNFYAKKLVATANRIVLFDGRNADVFTTSLEYRGGIHVAGTVDVAANDANLFALTNTLGVAEYTRDAQPLGAALIAEGSDAQPLSLAAINGAVWASIQRGCPLNCEKKTIVFDARGATPSQSATMTGAVRDVVVSGTRAYVLTELPDEIRILDVTDPAHPRQLAARASEGTPLPTSIAYENGVVYVLGQKLYTYDDALNKLAEPLGLYVDDPSSGVTFADQRVRIQSDCLAITGRKFSPQLFSHGVAAPAPVTPAAARSISMQPGRLYVLTDQSLEIWSSSPPAAGRRRAAR